MFGVDSSSQIKSPSVRMRKGHSSAAFLCHLFSFRALCLSVSLCLLFFAGCGKKGPFQPGEKKERSGEKQSQDIEKENFLLIGLVPEHRIFSQIDNYEPLAEYLSGKLNRKIKLIIIPDYGSFLDNFISTGMDGAFLGSFTYILGHNRMGLEPIARPEGADGRSTYYGVIFTRKDSRIKTARDMEKKTFVFVDKATASGYLLPLIYFKKNGITNYRSYFREWYIAGTHDDAIYDVLSGQADIGAAKNTALEALARTDARISRELQVLYTSPEFPETPFCVRKDLDADVKKALKETLLNMHKDDKGIEALRKLGVKRYIETSDADYSVVYRYARTAGIDISTFNYADEK
jgi:phosphonate transport system substrate-binding protein